MSSTQKAFLTDAKRRLQQTIPSLTWDQFANLFQIEPRALKTYRMPETSADYRVMPKALRAAIEHRVQPKADSAAIPDVSDPKDVPATVIVQALAALVVRQSRIAVLERRGISGLDRTPGTTSGLTSEDRRAMALVSRARLSQGQSDIGSEIHELLWHCTQALGGWLSLPDIYSEQLSQIVLLDAEEGVPTREADELARNFGGVSAGLEEMIFGRFKELLLTKNSRATAEEHYTLVREFVVRNPITTSEKLNELTRRLHVSVGQFLTQTFYEPVPEHWLIGEDVQLCAHCGNSMGHGVAALKCRTNACSETHAELPGARIHGSKALRLGRGLRQYWQEPGVDEISLFDALKQASHNPALYPSMDRVDIEVGDVGMDLKAYASPELLAARISRSAGGLLYYRKKWLVIPDRLTKRVPAYMDRLKARLTNSDVRCLTAAQVLKEIRHA
ncbi:MAG TPA: hypothetical protein VHP37_32390 [Burkholderiales bacterium]|nr:hypothetical protein [Burkholderiales bacterium]